MAGRQPAGENDRQWYEKYWAGFRGVLELQLSLHLQTRRPLLRLLERHLPSDRPVRFLEVGCGTALDTCLLASQRPAARAVALDLSREAVGVARRNAGALRLPVATLAADLTALPFAANRFDLVFSQGVLEHFRDPDPAICEQLRVLCPGGVLVVDVPQKFNLYTLRKRRAMHEGRWAWGWETEYSAGDLRRWAARFGLTVCGMAGHDHGRWLDRILIHPHRTLRNRWHRRNGQPASVYHPGPVARAWESVWDWLDARIGPFLAINIAVAFRKLPMDQEP